MKHTAGQTPFGTGLVSPVDPSRLEQDIATVRRLRGPWAVHRGNEHPPADWDPESGRAPSRFPIGYVPDEHSGDGDGRA
jgi:hypothetical protein